jgi:hypothetical protein
LAERLGCFALPYRQARMFQTLLQKSIPTAAPIDSVP